MPKVSVQYENQQRERIIEGAALAFAVQGYRQTTVDDIAKKLELSKGAIYIYFKSKEELFAAIFESLTENRIVSLQFASNSEKTVLGKLEKVLDQFIEILIKRDNIACRIWLEFCLEGPRIPLVAALKESSDQKIFELVQSLLDEGQRSGELKTGLDMVSITTVILATCDGLLLNTLTEKQSNPSAIRKAMWDTFHTLLKA